MVIYTVSFIHIPSYPISQPTFCHFELSLSHFCEGQLKMVTLEQERLSTQQYYQRSQQQYNNIHNQKICDELDITIIEFFDGDIFNNLEQEMK